METSQTDQYDRLQGLVSANGPQVCQTAFQLINKILENIITHPEESKFRSVRRSNKAIQAKLLACRGIVQFMQSIGFQDIDGDTLSYSDSSVSGLEEAHAVIGSILMDLEDELKTPEQREREARQREIRERMRKQKEERDRLLQQSRYDIQENRDRVVTTKTTFENNGPRTTSFKDIGVDLNAQRKG